MKKSKKSHNIRKNKSYFIQGKAGTLEQFLIATVITGLATGIGIFLGNWLIRAFLDTVEKSDILPQPLKNSYKVIR